LGASPCAHMVLDVDLDEAQTAGPWSDHFDVWSNRLARAVLAQAQSNVEPTGLLRHSVKKLRTRFPGKKLQGDAAEDALWDIEGEMSEVLECLLSDVDGLAEVKGVVDGAGISSSGRFYFARDPERALNEVERQIDFMCAS
jgi:hypothetical protein